MAVYPVAMIFVVGIVTVLVLWTKRTLEIGVD